MRVPLLLDDDFAGAAAVRLAGQPLALGRITAVGALGTGRRLKMFAARDHTNLAGATGSRHADVHHAAASAQDGAEQILARSGAGDGGFEADGGRHRGSVAKGPGTVNQL